MKNHPVSREIVVYPNCQECHRLWQELSSAAKAYVTLYEGIKGVAGKGLGAEFIKVRLRKAAEGRRSARKAVKRHEAERHYIPPQVVPPVVA